MCIGFKSIRNENRAKRLNYAVSAIIATDSTAFTEHFDNNNIE